MTLICTALYRSHSITASVSGDGNCLEHVDIQAEFMITLSHHVRFEFTLPRYWSKQVEDEVKSEENNQTTLFMDFGETCCCFIFLFTKFVDELSTPTWFTVPLRWVIAAALDNEALRDAITVPPRLIYKRIITPVWALLSGNGFLETLTEVDMMGRYAPQAKEWRHSRRWI